MKLVYLRGKNPKILDSCGYNTKYESYFRRLVRCDGVEWLSNKKVLGKIDDQGMYHPNFPYGITPDFQKKVAKILKLRICMTGSMGESLYYYDGMYHRARELFG